MAVTRILLFSSLCLTLLLSSSVINAQGVPGAMESALLAEDAAKLAKEARENGDPIRGAIVFFQPHMACTKCHTAGKADKPLGPDLANTKDKVTAQHLVESVLQPNKVVKKGFESIVVVTDDGRTLTGILESENDDALVLRDVARDGKLITIDQDTIDARKENKQSIMPAGLVAQLTSRQQFLDLVSYLIEITEKGPLRAAELEPAPALYAARPLPEYEKRIDHAGMIADLDQAAFKRGEAIYNRLCINCHGTKDKPGSLPTSLKFASGKFKNGSDPYTMYQTLTKGFGMMVAQSWMVPQQKYDVIHYIRQSYLKPHNPSQLFEADNKYLASLPMGDTRGPAPANIQEWSLMDYGRSLVHTYEVGNNATNFAYKGIATRLDPGPGGVSRGRNWMVFDHDTLRAAVGWSGKGFIDWNGIMFNGRHGVHPRVVGEVQFANPTGPGWANPKTGDFEDPRLRGRDDRLYGPLPREWAHYKGLYHHGNDTIVSYTVGDTSVLEMSGQADAGAHTVFTRTFNIGPRSRDMILQVANLPGTNGVAKLKVDAQQCGSAVIFGAGAPPEPTTAEEKPAAKDGQLRFDGATSLVAKKSGEFDLNKKSYTVFARIKTKSNDGTIFSQSPAQGNWAKGGKTLFLRGGRLCVDFGWVGAVQGNKRVNDGKWHDVAITFDHKSSELLFYVDGKLDKEGELEAEFPAKGHVIRIGYTSPNFPTKNNHFKGSIEEVRFYNRQLSDDEVASLPRDEELAGLQAAWHPVSTKGNAVADWAKHGHEAMVTRGQVSAGPANATADGSLLAGVSNLPDATWSATDGNNLRLKIPAGKQPLRFTLWLARVDTVKHATDAIDALVLEEAGRDLAKLTKGGPARWPEKLKTVGTLGNDDGPYAVDVLTRPASNPWNARVRLTGLDFYADGKRAAVSTWDGDVWLVTGIDQPQNGLTWQRIGSGLFQPLGVRVIDETVYLTCRDQLVILRDYNGDGETDFYESFNNDHQVTEHFHEFAMGLQTDDQGNFYYAKSARHAKTALVPHHGTLLRVSKDGSKTDILATGFRAANGVCLNPDGTYIVTDQEGHWNPKNRINYVKEGGFYGNMYGYHDVTDSSDSAMEQPLCWITNSFDRSPPSCSGWTAIAGDR